MNTENECNVMLALAAVANGYVVNIRLVCYFPFSFMKHNCTCLIDFIPAIWCLYSFVLRFKLRYISRVCCWHQTLWQLSIGVYSRDMSRHDAGPAHALPHKRPAPFIESLMARLSRVIPEHSECLLSNLYRPKYI